MNSDINHNQPLDAEAFARYIERRLRQEDAIELGERVGMQLPLHIGAHSLKLDLSNFYRAYHSDPAQLPSVAEKLALTLRGYLQARTMNTFADVRERVYPMLKPIALLADLHERELPLIVYRPFLADLIISYVIDQPASVAYINEEQTERWQIGEHELHEQALANLKRRTDEQNSATITGAGAQRLIVFNRQDGYDATRLLLVPILDGWRAQFPGHMVIGVPNRDFLIAFSDADRTILTNIAHQIQLDAVQRDHGLTDQLFTLVGGEIRTYECEV